MASLLDLTVQGDVATISDESKLPEIRLMGPLELYRLWERQNWASHQIDLEQDRRDRGLRSSPSRALRARSCPRLRRAHRRPFAARRCR